MQALINSLAQKDIEIEPSLKYMEAKDAYLDALISCAPLCIGYMDCFLKCQNLSDHAFKWFRLVHKKYKNTNLEAAPLGEDLSSLFPTSEALAEGLQRAKEGTVWKTAKPLVFTFEFGDSLWLDWEVFPWRDLNGNIEKIVFLFEDVSHQHELNAIKDKLININTMLENYSMVFAHDVIQPLRQVSNFVQLIEDDCKRNPEIFSPTSKLAFDGIQSSLEHIKSLCEGIITYSKQGELTVFPEPVRVSNLIREIMKSILGFKKNTLVSEIDENVIVYANPVCLRQLFQNLVTNAIKHSSSEKNVTLSGEFIRKKFYKFHIHNYGYCPSNIRKNKKLLEAFQSSHHDGSGLGLMICKKIIDAYGGKLTVRSTRSHGTTVSFTLPLYNFDQEIKESKLPPKSNKI
jgi:signal transduction histidine kinase